MWKLLLVLCFGVVILWSGFGVWAAFLTSDTSDESTGNLYSLFLIPVLLLLLGIKLFKSIRNTNERNKSGSSNFLNISILLTFVVISIVTWPFAIHFPQLLFTAFKNSF